MFKIKEESLEWALKHLQTHPSSDFFPKIFEFEAMSHNWQEVKDFILKINLKSYVPKSPIIELAIKTNKNFRIVHQLDPIDSIIYTALIYEVCIIIEDFRIPEIKKISCSYRIEPDMDGSFFKKKQGYGDFIEKTEELAQKYENGYVLSCDITDFYNQIYTHRIQNIISEAGGPDFEEHARIIEHFILELNSNTSRGIPVGPEPSIILSEAIMADIDKKILTYTCDFAQYVDDIRIFFDDEDTALRVLHDLTRYLHISHRLVFSSVKTSIKETKDFMENHFRNEEREETIAIINKQEELAFEEYSDIVSEEDPYAFFIEEIDQEKFEMIFERIGEEEQLKILSETYAKLFQEELEKEKPNLSVLRHIIRKCIKYRRRCIVPIILDNFETLVPIVRDTSVYLSKVLNEKAVALYDDKFKRIIESEYCKLPYVNTWISFLLQQKAFQKSNLSIRKGQIISIRDRALIAKLKNDTIFVKDYKEGIDILAPWDKRAVLFSAEVLSHDEMRSWLSLIARKNDIIDRSIANYVIATKKTKTKK